MANVKVVVVGTGLPQVQDRGAAPPLALQTFGSQILLDNWWNQLANAGLADAQSTYIATNAFFYKYLEVWGFSKGIALPHIVNSGRSLGDNRVDWHTVSLVLQRIAAEGNGSDVLLFAGDTLPPANWDVASFVESARAAGKSGLLLQKRTPAAAPPTGGPRILAHFSGEETAKQVMHIETSAGRPIHLADTMALPSPLVYYIAAQDVSRLLQADAVPTMTNRLGDLTTGSAAGVAAEALIPLETCMGLLATENRVSGFIVEGMFTIGSADGSKHEVPQGAHAPSPYAHHLPAALAHTSGSSTVPSGSDSGVIHARSYARVGAMGNPSDGYGGKTLSVTVANFRADAWLAPNGDASDSRITFLPHPLGDPLSFGSISHVSTLVGREGYSGGIRLMMAVVHRFCALVAAKGAKLHGRGFSLRYHTTVPRQVGLAGSSALVTAMVRALLRHYGLESEEAAVAALGLSKDTLPSFVLAVESEELGIVAGLQDRVVQAYEGAVHMNFNPELLKEKGHGAYTRIPVHALPPLFLAYAADPSDSGRIHAPVKQRWLAGDKEVVDGMSAIANLADDAFALCTTKPYGAAATCADREEIAHAWAGLMAANFNGRRKLFGDGALGKDNIRMIEIARECGSSGKFPGSGGAILGVVDVEGMAAAGRLGEGAPELPGAGASPEAHASAAAARVAVATAVLRSAYHAEGYVFVRLQPREAPAEGAGRVTD